MSKGLQSTNLSSMSLSPPLSNLPFMPPADQRAGVMMMQRVADDACHKVALVDAMAE
jgi:hypothetical protein